MVQYDTEWYRMVQNGTEWYSLIQNSTQWYSLIQTGHQPTDRLPQLNPLSTIHHRLHVQRAKFTLRKISQEVCKASAGVQTWDMPSDAIDDTMDLTHRIQTHSHILDYLHDVCC